MNVPVEKVRVYYRSSAANTVAPHGYVIPKEPERVSFLQAIVVALAPLFLSTWLFFLCLDIFTIEGLNIWFYICAGFLCVSLLIGSSPSSGDINFCIKSLKQNLSYSAYQVILLLTSILTVAFFINYSWMILPFEFLYYIAQYITIGVLYFAYKYLFKGTSLLIRNQKKISHLTLNRITRKRHRPIKPHKLGIEEPHW
jgi:hypothetical protein